MKSKNRRALLLATCFMLSLVCHNLAFSQNSESGDHPSGKCFIKTSLKCGTYLGVGGGTRTVCDLTGYYTPNETCTETSCTIGDMSPIWCNYN